MSELTPASQRRASAQLRYPKSLALGLGGLLLFLTSTALAAAAEPQLACLLRPKAEGLAPRDLALLEAAVATTLKQQEILPTSQRERDTILDQEGLSGCYHDSCLDRIGRQLSVQRVIAYRVSATAADQPTATGSDWEPPPAGEHWRRFAIAVSYYNVEVGAVGGRLESSCPHCSTFQAAVRLAALLRQAIGEDAQRPRRELSIDTSPPGAALLIDGIEVGSTPYRHPAFLGRHEVMVRKSGFRSQVAVLTLRSGPQPPLELRLLPGRDTERTTIMQEHQPRPKWRLGLGGALLGLGLGSIGVGAYGLAIDGDCFAPAVAPATVCSQLRSGRPAGLGFTIGGGVAAGLGVLLLALPGARNQQPLSEPDRDTFGALAREPAVDSKR